MEEETPVIYGLEFQARALTAQAAESDVIRFFVGTQSLKFDNQIHLVELDEENNALHRQVFLHKEGEVWHMSASLKDPQILATCYNKVSAVDKTCIKQTGVWKLPDCKDSESSDEIPPLELQCRLDSESFGEDVKCTYFHPNDGNQLVTVIDSHFLIWDIAEGKSLSQAISKGVLEGKGQPRFTTGKWNPHQGSGQVVTANDTHIRGWDIRNGHNAWTIENAHCQLVRDVDFNPNRQYFLASCGDDGHSKFWDIRKTTEPIMTRSDHSHWVWSIRYNHFHDQLVLTSSTDSRVILISAASISSEPYGHIDEELASEDEKPSPIQDGVLATYEEHEDSVYAVEWSTVDPWTFASLSYDGRLVINKVPRTEKYRILL